MDQINAFIVDQVERFLRKLREDGMTIDAAYLFGSYARSQESAWSDIDVAIISHDFTGSRFEEGIRLAKIAQHIDTRIEPIPFYPNAFVEDDPLVWEIKKEGIRLDNALSYKESAEQLLDTIEGHDD